MHRRPVNNMKHIFIECPECEGYGDIVVYPDTLITCKKCNGKGGIPFSFRYFSGVKTRKQAIEKK